MASGSGPISRSESGHEFRLLPVPLNKPDRRAWIEFCREAGPFDPNSVVYCDEENFYLWEKFRKDYNKAIAANPPTPEERDHKEDMPSTEEDTQKLFRQAVSAPDNYDGNRKEFTNWWANMQIYLMGYQKI